MKKLLLSVMAGFIAFPLLGVSFVEQSEARPMARKVCKPGVAAVGRAGGSYVSYRAKKRRAARRARANWRRKVINRYGWRYMRWSRARNKRIRCRGGEWSVRCRVRARPCKRSFRGRDRNMRDRERNGRRGRR